MTELTQHADRAAHRRHAERRHRRARETPKRSSFSTAFPNCTAPGGRSRRRWPGTISWSARTSAASARRTSRRASSSIEADRIVEDLIALADALELEQFTLVGHDWGGAVAWLAALRQPDRIERLVIVNAPHPLVFQKSLIEDPAPARRQPVYHRLPQPDHGARARGDGAARPSMRRPSPAMRTSRKVSDEERAAYLDRLGGAGRAHRDAELVPGERGRRARARRGGRTAGLDESALPADQDADARRLGMRDTALLPVQLGGLCRSRRGAAHRPGPRRRPFHPLGEARASSSRAIRDFMRRP